MRSRSCSTIRPSRAICRSVRGSAAIYTQVGKPTHIISKVAMRMKKWLLYVAPTVAKA